MDKIPRILVIDDDRTVCQSLKLLLKKAGYEVQTIFNPLNAVEFIQEYQPDLVLLDMNFTIDTTGTQGLQILDKIRGQFPNQAIILITGWGTMKLAINGMKKGAKDFITKPWDNSVMLSAVQNVLQLHANQAREEASRNKKALDKIIGDSSAIQSVKALIKQVAPTDATVLITGESGTGKELVAEAIHDLSKRNAHPFVKVNLGGLTASLFESELFGHKKGAFTGAIENRKGRFELAEKGTIFLDEIGDVAMDLQVKLLRVLQERTFEPVGSSKPKKANVRVISATHKSLPNLIQSQQFREDLYYRINLLHIHLPALRERHTDIPLLADFFVAKMNQSYGVQERYIVEEARQWLSKQEYKGNIRQLKNLVERAWLLATNKSLGIQDFRPHLQSVPQLSSHATPAVGSMTLEELERNMIAKTLAYYNNNLSQVATALGLTRSSLYRRLEKYDIVVERE